MRIAAACLLAASCLIGEGTAQYGAPEILVSHDVDLTVPTYLVDFDTGDQPSAFQIQMPTVGGYDDAWILLFVHASHETLSQRTELDWLTPPNPLPASYAAHIQASSTLSGTLNPGDVAALGSTPMGLDPGDLVDMLEALLSSTDQNEVTYSGQAVATTSGEAAVFWHNSPSLPSVWGLGTPGEPTARFWGSAFETRVTESGGSSQAHVFYDPASLADLAISIQAPPGEYLPFRRSADFVTLVNSGKLKIQAVALATCAANQTAPLGDPLANATCGGVRISVSQPVTIHLGNPVGPDDPPCEFRNPQVLPHWMLVELFGVPNPPYFLAAGQYLHFYGSRVFDDTAIEFELLGGGSEQRIIEIVSPNLNRVLVPANVDETGSHYLINLCGSPLLGPMPTISMPTGG